MNSAFEKRIQYVMSTVIVLFPLCWYPYAYFPYEQPQALWWRAASMFVFGVVAILLYTRGVVYIPRFSKAVWILIGCSVVAIALSTIFAWSPNIAVWGSQYRFQGILAVVSYVLGAYSAYILYVKQEHTVLAILALSGVLLSIYAILQRIGLDPWNNPFRVHASFGHPNSLAAFLLITTAATSMATYIFRKWSAVVYASAFLLQWIALWMTFTRTAWVVGFISVMSIAAYGFMLYRKNAERTNIRWLAITVGTMLLLFVSYMVVRGINQSEQFAYTATQSTVPLAHVLEDAEQNQIEANPLDHRLQSIVTDVQASSLSIRWYIWKDTVRILNDRWLIGVGNDNMQIQYPKYYGAESNRPQIARSTYADRAHNHILDTWLSFGLFGVMSLYALLAWFMWHSYRYIRSGKNKSEQQVAFVGFAVIVVFLLHLYYLLAFSVTVDLAVLFIIAGVSLRITQPVRIKKLTFAIHRKLFIVALLACVSGFIFKFSMLPFFASVNAYAYNNTGVSHTELESRMIRSMEMDPYMPEYSFLMAKLQYSTAVAVPQEQAMPFLQNAERYAKDARNKGLIKLEYWDFMVDVYDSWATIDPEYVSRKHAMEEKIRSQATHFGDVYKVYE